VALNFPNSPGIGSVFVDTDSGFSYKWDGTVWSGFVGQQPSEIKALTDISSSFNGVLTTFALAHDGSAVHPVNSAQLRVVLGGVVQAAGSDYTISTSNIVFTTAPIAALDCAITLLGTALALNVPADESVTPGKLSTGGPKWNTSGDVYISGIATANNGLVVGVGLTLGDNVKLNLGTGSDLQIVHDGSNSIIDDAGTGSLVLKSDTEIKFLKRTGDENILVGTPDGSVGLFYDNTKRFETTTGGALVYGTVGAGQTALVVEGDVRVTGVVTASSGSFTGNVTVGTVAGSTGTFTGDVDIADKIVHTGDTNTSLRFPAADTFTVETAGSERLRINSGGNVAIGTDSPQSKLHVSAEVDAESFRLQNDRHTFRFDNVKTGTGTNWNAYQQVLEHGVDTTTQEFIKFGSGNDSPTKRINLGTAEDADLMHLVTNQVGIGTSLPQSKLHVQDVTKTGTAVGSNLISRFLSNASDGDAHIQISNGVDHSALIGIQDGANIYFALDGTERLRIASAGQIGLGGANYGTSGQVLSSNGSGSAPTWQDAGGGSWNLLSTTTASSASTVDITSNINSTYKRYVIELLGLVTGHNQLRMSLYVNGTLNSSNNYSSYFDGYSAREGQSASSNSARSDNAGYMLMNGLDGTDSDGINDGRVILNDPSRSNFDKYVVFSEYYSVGNAGSSYPSVNYGHMIGGMRNTSGGTFANVTGIRFVTYSGTITGTFKLYGIT